MGYVSEFSYKIFLQERIPPSIDDFLYICDGAYKRRDIKKMEVNVLKVIDFDLGIPLSYRFLRRYARVSFFSSDLALLLCIIE